MLCKHAGMPLSVSCAAWRLHAGYAHEADNGRHAHHAHAGHAHGADIARHAHRGHAHHARAGHAHRADDEPDPGHMREGADRVQGRHRAPAGGQHTGPVTVERGQARAQGARIGVYAGACMHGGSCDKCASARPLCMRTHTRMPKPITWCMPTLHALLVFAPVVQTLLP